MSDTGIGWAKANVDRILRNPPEPTAEELELAREALARMDARANENVQEWAEKLAKSMTCRGKE